MTSKPKQDRAGQILDSLKSAAAGDYSKKLDFASENDELGIIADAVNALLQKTDERLSAFRQKSSDLTDDALRYRHILDNIEESYFEVDLKGNLFFFNDTVIRDLGYSQEELRGIHFHKLVDEINAKKVYEAFHQVFLTGRPIQGFDWEILKKNKEKINVESSVSLMFDETGRPAGFRGVVRNISQRVQTQKDLWQSEEKYRHILESMDETYLETDLKGNFIFFNDSLCRVLGFSRDELLNANYRLISPPEQVQNIFEMFNEIYRTGQTRSFVDHAIMKKDGSIIYLEMSISLMRSPTGEPIGFSGISRDVTEKIKVRLKIEENERHLRLITDNIRDIIWTMNFDLRWTYLSPSVLRITGYTPEEVMKIPLKAMLPPETYALIKQTLSDELSKEISGPVPDEQRRTTIFEMPLMRKSGESLWVEISADLNRDENGKPFEIIGISRDISERKKTEEALKESEALYRKALETTSDGVSIMQDGKYVYLNPRFLNTLGIPEDYPIGEQMGVLMHPDDRKVMKEYYEKRLRGEPTPGIHDVRVVKPDQTMIYLQVTSIDIVYQGKPALLSFMQDITQRKQAEDALKASEKRYRIMAENANDIVWTLGLNLQFIYASPSHFRVTGFTPEDVNGMTLPDFITPDSFVHVSQVLSEEIALETSGTPVDPNRSRTLELEVHTKDGDHNVWLEVNATFNRDANGKATEILAIGRNITQRRHIEKALGESEKRYRMIVENMQDVICIVDFNFQFTYVSSDNLKLTGYTKEEVTGIPIDKLITPESLLLITNMLGEELEREKNRTTFNDPVIRILELEIFHKAGGTTWAEVTATLIRDEQGKPAGILLVAREITERKKIQEALKESEKRYRMIVENMNDIIWVMDLDFRYKYRSPSNIQITGHTPEEITAIPPRDHITPESYALVEKILTEEIALEFSGKPVDPHRSRTIEVEVYHKNGGTVWIEVTGSFTRDEQGKPVEILLSAREVTERKKIQEALKESEKLYRIIAENVHGSIALLDLNFEYLYLSPSEIRITGYTPDELMRIPLKDQMTPESYGLVEKILVEELARECSGEQIDPDRSRTMELEVYHKNGNLVWEEVTTTFNRDENGKPVGLLVTTRDITERRKAQEDLRKSEQRYRMIIENMHEVIWTTDLNLQYTYVSPSSLWVAGYTPEEIASLPTDQLLTADSFALAQNALAEEITREFSGEPVDKYRSRTIEQELYHKNGGTVWLDVTATFTRDENDKPVGMLMAGKDITARKKAEEEKDKLEAQLIQAQKMETVGRLAGGVAHDFNNMLSVILGYVDLAKLRLARQHPVLKDIAEIEKAAIRSRDITTQLLAFSRKQIIEPKIIDLNDLVAHTQKALTRLIGEDIELKVILEENLWAILFDPSQIEQILINLAVNARDAMQGGGKLTIETANAVLDASYCENNIGFKPGHYVRLSFSDNGMGMDKEILQHIFEPFFTTKEAGKGTGLGLATVYGIVKQNSGFINVYSEREHGTTFSLYLPRASGERVVQDEFVEEPEIAGTGNILLVEDDAMVLQITTGMLESIGYTVIVADNPLDALSLCKNPDTSIDLVISDVVMPVMSGKELRNKLIAIRPGLKVIFMSGYTADVIEHHGVLEEGVLFLQKPFSIKALARKVRAALALK